jgi:SAM-dependent methyltransferase
LTLCFIADPGKALKECGRILRPDGSLVLGIIPAESSWGTAYESKKAQGHYVYASATFHRISEILAFAKCTDFTLRQAASALFWNPDGPPEIPPRIEADICPGAGFIGLLFKNRRTLAQYLHK